MTTTDHAVVATRAQPPQECIGSSNLVIQWTMNTRHECGGSLDRPAAPSLTLHCREFAGAAVVKLVAGHRRKDVLPTTGPLRHPGRPDG